ncbi:MAG TPA: protein kinase, partial [Gemmatimonadales bacterium]|nr:protein kinase [Gemmatimonadales bacterium]
RQRLQREKQLPVGDVIRILSDVADALAYAHDKGVVHRDIKPDNILLAGRHALVTDFGVAKAVSIASAGPQAVTSGVALGTPAYMAPEQALAEPDLDQRVDIYALSVVGYELLTGAPPFDGPTPQAILTAHVLDAVPLLAERRSDVPAGLTTVIERGLAKQRTDRWPTAHELVHALEPLATPSGGSTPAGVPPVARRPSLLWLAVGVVVLAALAIGGYLARPPAPVTGFSESQLTFSGSVRSSAISPDGQFLAFVADSAGAAWLMVQETRGGRAIPLARAGRMGHVSWSGDGSEVRAFAYDAGASYLQTVPRLGGPSKLLKVSPWSVPSPDGTRIFDLPQGGMRVKIRNMVQGDSITAPLEAGWWFSPPVWSPDGRWVAAAAFQQTGAGARLVVMSATDLSTVVALEDSVALGTPAWDGRSRALYYLRGSTGLVDLYRLPLDRNGKGQAAPELVRAGLSVGSPDVHISFTSPVSISSDGTRLVYTQRHEWSNLGMVAFDDWKKGGTPTPLTTGSARFKYSRISPDGRKVAVIREQTDGATLQLLPLGPGQPEDVGRFHEGLGLAWAPNGQRILICIVEPDSGIGIRIYNLGDLTAQTRFYGGTGATPEWLDDSTLVAPRPGNRSLQLLPLDGRPPRLMPGVDTTGWMLWPRRSPDGRYVVYAWNAGRNRQDVQLLSLRDSTSRELASGIMDPIGWSSDSRQVYLSSSQYLDDADKIVVISIAGGAARPVAEFPPDLEVLEVTPDGRRAVLNMQQHQSDAWMMRLNPRK